MRSTLRLPFGSLVGAPGFAAVALLTLALGVRMNAAIFATLNSYRLRPLSYSSAEPFFRLDRVTPPYPFGNRITDTQRSLFRYPGLDLTWEHRTWGVSPIPPRHWTDQWGTRFHGKKGMLIVTMYGYEFIPTNGDTREGFHLLSTTGNQENLDFSKESGCYDETSQRHVVDFMKARENRSRPVADIEEGHISSACAELANLSLELGRPLAYDPKTRTIPGDAEATRRLARPYRAPWIHPDFATV